MPAANLRLSLTPSGVPTEYDLFSPDPAQWEPAPTSFGFQAVVSVIEGPAGNPPTSRVLTRGGLPDGYRRLRSVPILADWMSVASRAPLQVAAAGSQPVAAVGPVSRVPVDISFQSASGDLADESLTVHAPFGRVGPGGAVVGDGVPLVDVSGRHIVFWTQVSGLPIIANSYESHPPPPYSSDAPQQFDTVNETFPSLPVVTPRAGRSAWLIVDVIPNSAFAIRIDARPTLRVPPTQNFFHPDGFDQRGLGNEALDVSAPRISTEAAALVKQYARASKNPTIWLPGISFLLDETQVSRRIPHGNQSAPTALFNPPGWKEPGFQYPPAPPARGVNVFGAISSLDMSYAEGDLVIGPRAEPRINAGTPVELRDIRGTGIVGRRMIIPVQLNAGHASIAVQGSAVVLINGQAVRGDYPWWHALLPSGDAWSFGLAILAVALTTAGFATSTTRRRRD
jgi:hypothetical protein